jgi:uncharacterized membrane protein
MSMNALRSDGAGREDAPGAAAPPVQRLARGLGWASLALGLPQTAAPGRFAKAIGVRDDAESRLWNIAVGLREHAAAAGILLVEWPRPVTTLWARVGGDVMDLTLLANAWRSKREHTGRLAGAIAAVIGISMADIYAAVMMSRIPEQAPEQERHGTHVKAAVTVRRSREDVYRFWHDFHNLPTFMGHLESVQVTGEGRSRWKAHGPAGRSVEWDAEVIDDRPNEMIAWRSIDGAGIDNQGSVRFLTAPGDRGTEIHVSLDYSAPGGPLAVAVAKMLGEEPQQQVKDDLRRFKQVVETGQVVRSEGTPEGTHTRRLVLQRPAQPPPDAERFTR